MIDRRRAYWLCQIGGWGGFYAISAAFFALRFDYTWNLFIHQAMGGVLGIGLTHAFRGVVHRRGWTHLPLQPLLVRVLSSTLALAALRTAIAYLAVYTTPLGSPFPAEAGFWSVVSVLGQLFNASLLYLFWSAVYFGLHAFWNYRQAEVDKWKLEAQAEAARLKALKLQLNPHFFFNSLNSVRTLIMEDPDRAQTMVSRLAHLLRRTLRAGEEKTVPLEEELSTVRTYLELEEVRLGDRLTYEIDLEDGARESLVPHLLVQTLVENGIKHGVAQRSNGGRVRVTAEEHGNATCIQVENTGHLDVEEGGLGLANVRERLQLLFGEEASLTLEEPEPGTVVATAWVPEADREPEGMSVPPVASLSDRRLEEDRIETGVRRGS